MTKTSRTLLWVQGLVILGGFTFAWTQWIMLFLEVCNECSLGGDVNPWTSKCFYGALVFTLALILHIWLMISLKKKAQQ